MGVSAPQPPEVAYLTPDRTPRLVKAPEGKEGAERREVGRRWQEASLCSLCTPSRTPGSSRHLVPNVRWGAGEMLRAPEAGPISSSMRI